MKTVKTIFVIIICAAFILAGCKKESETPKSKFIRIGALLPLTGSGASPGESGNAAIAIALQEINDWIKNQNINSPLFEVLVEDTKTDSEAALIAYGKLKAQGVQIIIGPFSSTVLKSVKPCADADNILLVSPASVASSIAQPGDNVFRLIPNVVSQGQALSALIADDGIEVLIPVMRNDIWGNELNQATKSFFIKNGGIMLDPVMYSPSDMNFGIVAGKLNIKVNKALETFPSDKIGIYLIGYGESYDILNEARKFNSLNQLKWYGNSAFAEDKNIINDLETANFASEISLSCPSYGLDPALIQKWEPVLEKLKNKMGRSPEIFAFTAYDALWLTAQTYLITGEKPKFMNLKATFERLAENYFGITGWTKLDENGDREIALYDFWGIVIKNDEPEWEIVARFNNITEMLERY